MKTEYRVNMTSGFASDGDSAMFGAIRVNAHAGTSETIRAYAEKALNAHPVLLAALRHVAFCNEAMREKNRMSPLMMAEVRAAISLAESGAKHE